ncbi:hypothetical protein UlMin_039381 [Ulmus minor]
MEENRGIHFVLVHGACHGAWCWYKVTALLKSRGHKVTALDMAASGIHPKQVQDIKFPKEYTQPLIDFMASLPPEERVILVGHSMGGVCIALAMQRFPEKISAAVFASAIMPCPDLSLSAMKGEFDRRLDSYMDTQFTSAGESNHPATILLFGPKFLESKLYQLSPPEDLVLALSLVRAIIMLSTPPKEVEYTKEKYGSVCRVYLVCNQDNVNKPDFQRWMIENNPPDEVKVIENSDHMVMFSRPLELCSCLQDIAARYS